MSSGAVTGSTALTFRMLSGFPGDDLNPEIAWDETHFLNSTYVPAFGAPVVLASSLARSVQSGDVASDVYGFMKRVAPQIGGTPDANGQSTAPNASIEQPIKTKGIMSVICAVGTPVMGGVVYVREVADTGKAIGDLEATSDATVAAGVVHGTGTGTIAASVDNTKSPLLTGTYTITLLSTSQTALCSVIDPAGKALPDAKVGTTYTYGGLTFTITAAGTMTIGDYFIPVVTKKNGPISGCRWFVDGKDANNVTAIRVDK